LLFSVEKFRLAFAPSSAVISCIPEL
jgi:hypothetical protein